MLQISETKEEGVVHLPHIEIFRKWRENEELDLHDANVIRPVRAPPSPTMVTATAKGNLVVHRPPAHVIRAVPIKETNSFYNIGYRTKKVLLFNLWFL